MSDNRDYHLNEIDCNKPKSFDETCFVKHFAKEEGRFACSPVFRRGQGAIEGTEGRRGDREPWRGPRAVEGTEGHRGDRGL